jgi:nucleotide-binding universal stress UspA family protein
MLASQKNEPLRILLADDGSEHSEAARRLVADLPLQDGSGITVLRAFASTQAAELAPLEKSLDQACEFFMQKGLQARPELLLGSPSEVVVDYAEKHHPDLIVVGAKGLRATLGILLGGVAQQVVEYACCPVLVVRAPYSGLHRLLLVTDGSPSSRLAAQYLGRLPLPPGVKVQVLHVLPPPPIHMILENTSFGAVPMTTTEQMMEAETALREKEEKEAHELLEASVRALPAALSPEGVLKRGDAATEIMTFAKENAIDLIVTGSRGLSPIRSWLMGSVSRKLVHYSGCSVLVVRSAQPA